MCISSQEIDFFVEHGASEWVKACATSTAHYPQHAGCQSRPLTTLAILVIIFIFLHIFAASREDITALAVKYSSKLDIISLYISLRWSAKIIIARSEISKPMGFVFRSLMIIFAKKIKKGYILNLIADIGNNSAKFFLFQEELIILHTRRNNSSFDVIEEWSGLYEGKNGKLYINDGIGCVGYLLRFGARPEITVIELRRKK